MMEAVTHGRARGMSGGRRVQAHVAAATDPADISRMLGALQGGAQWSEASAWPCAFRVMTSDGGGADDTVGLVESSLEGTSQGTTSSSSSSSSSMSLAAELEEDCSDGGFVGAGEKLLHLLRRWDVYNVVVVVSVWEEGCSPLTKGPAGARFKALVEAAKEALERCFLDTTSTGLNSLSMGSSNFAAATASLSGKLSLVVDGHRHGDLDYCGSCGTKPKRKELKLKTGSVQELDNLDLQKPQQQQVKSNELCLVTAVPDFADSEMHELRSLNRPHPVVQEILAHVALVIGEQDVEWNRIRHVMHARTLSKRMRKVRVPQHLLLDLERWAPQFCPDTCTRNRIGATSLVAGKFMDWLQAIATVRGPVFPR